MRVYCEVSRVGGLGRGYDAGSGFVSICIYPVIMYNITSLCNKIELICSGPFLLAVQKRKIGYFGINNLIFLCKGQ